MKIQAVPRVTENTIVCSQKLLLLFTNSHPAPREETNSYSPGAVFLCQAFLLLLLLVFLPYRGLYKDNYTMKVTQRKHISMKLSLRVYEHASFSLCPVLNTHFCIHIYICCIHTHKCIHSNAGRRFHK